MRDASGETLAWMIFIVDEVPKCVCIFVRDYVSACKGINCSCLVYACI